MTVILIPITWHGATSLVSRGKLKLLKIMLHNFHELYHQAYLQFNDQATPQQQSRAEPPPPMSSDFQDQMLKVMSKMDQTMTSLAQAMTSLN
jgi:hypothetical protein